MKEKIKFPDAYVCDPFSSPYETVGLPFEGGQAVVETTYQKRKVSSGAELGALNGDGELKVKHVEEFLDSQFTLEFMKAIQTSRGS